MHEHARLEKANQKKRKSKFHNEMFVRLMLPIARSVWFLHRCAETAVTHIFLSERVRTGRMWIC